MINKAFNNWVLFPAVVGFYFHTAVSIPAMCLIQRSVCKCRSKERIWLLNWAPPCSPYVTQHCHHQVEVFVNWLTVASAAFGLSAEPGSHRCEEGELQFGLFLRVSTRHRTSCTFYALNCNDTTELQMQMQIYRSHIWYTETSLHIYKLLLFSILSDDRSKASSKTIPPHSAIQGLLFQMRVSSPVLKVIQ